MWNTNAPLPQHDLWPTDLKINRDHLLIKDYLPTTFEASGAKPSWVISCTRLRATDIPTDIPTDRPTGATQYAPPFSKGGIMSLLLNAETTVPWNRCGASKGKGWQKDRQTKKDGWTKWSLYGTLLRWHPEKKVSRQAFILFFSINEFELLKVKISLKQLIKNFKNI